MTDFTFTLGTRGSPLALAQARMTAAALEQAHHWAAGSVALLQFSSYVQTMSLGIVLILAVLLDETVRRLDR